MGVHLVLSTEDGEEHPDWDWLRHAGDSDFAGLLGSELGYVTSSEEDPWDRGMRPSDYAAWRAVIAAREWPNPGRFEKLVDLLQANIHHWLYVSR